MSQNHLQALTALSQPGAILMERKGTRDIKVSSPAGQVSLHLQVFCSLKDAGLIAETRSTETFTFYQLAGSQVLPAVKSLKGTVDGYGAIYQIDRVGKSFELTVWSWSWSLNKRVAIPYGTFANAQELVTCCPDLAKVNQWVISR